MAFKCFPTKTGQQEVGTTVPIILCPHTLEPENQVAESYKSDVWGHFGFPVFWTEERTRTNSLLRHRVEPSEFSHGAN